MTSERLVLENLEWAKGIASRFPVYGMEREDLNQEIAHALTKAANNYDPQTNNRFQGFAYFVIRNHLMNLGKKVGGYAKHLPEIESHQSFEIQMAAEKILAPDREANRNDLRQLLTEGLQNLTENQRTVITAHSLGHTNPEIAKKMGVTKQNIQATGKKAATRLRAEFERQGFTSMPRFMPSIPPKIQATSTPSPKPANPITPATASNHP